MRAATLRCAPIRRSRSLETHVEPGVEYWIEAVDAADPPNTAGAPAATFSVEVFTPFVDEDPPSIAHSPIEGLRERGVSVHVEAEITDETGVREAEIWYRPQAELDWLTAQMEAGDGDTWTGTIAGFAVSPPGVEYFIRARDESPQAWEATHPADAPDARHTFAVPELDDDGPEIVLVAVASPVESGTPVPVGADVTDASEIESVALFYRGDDEFDWHSVPMAAQGGDRYAATVPGEAVLPPSVHYFVEAVDAEGNLSIAPSLGEEASHRIDVVLAPGDDITPPAILHAGPGAALRGQPLGLSAIVTDASEVDRVAVWFRNPEAGGPWAAIDLASDDGERWRGVLPGFATGGDAVEYYLEAIDAAPARNTATDPADAPDSTYIVALIAPGPPDADVPDAGIPDADAPDAGAADAEIPDIGEPDAEIPDIGEPDVAAADAAAADAELAIDTGGGADAGAPDGASPDGGLDGGAGASDGCSCRIADRRGGFEAWLWLALFIVPLRRRLIRRRLIRCGERDPVR